MADIICICGMLSSALAFVGPNNTLTMFYHGLAVVAVSNRPDISLVSVGHSLDGSWHFRSTFFAPCTTKGFSLIPLRGQDEKPSTIVLQMLRFTLFKLMLMSGVVKIQANCPSWLDLRALEYHYATNAYQHL